MSNDLTFNCLSCGTALTASIEHCGHTVICPSCSTSVQIPTVAPVTVASAVILPPPPPPSLWRPNEAALWSILLTPAFSAFLHAKNAEALGREKEATANMVWFYLILLNTAWGILMICGILPDRTPLQAVISILILLGWYLTLGLRQASFVKTAFGNNYVRRSFDKPLLIWLGCAVGLGALAAIFVALFGPGQTQPEWQPGDVYTEQPYPASNAGSDRPSRYQSSRVKEIEKPEASSRSGFQAEDNRVKGGNDDNRKRESDGPVIGDAEEGGQPKPETGTRAITNPRTAEVPTPPPGAEPVPSEAVIRNGIKTLGVKDPILAGYRRGEILVSTGGNGKVAGTRIYPIKMPDNPATYYFYQNEFKDWFINIGGSSVNLQVITNFPPSAPETPSAQDPQPSAPIDEARNTQGLTGSPSNDDRSAAKARLAEISSRMETDKARYSSALAVINRLTNNKKTAVKEGSREFQLCLEASNTMKEIEAGVPALKQEKARLEAILAEQ